MKAAFNFIWCISSLATGCLLSAGAFEYAAMTFVLAVYFGGLLDKWAIKNDS